MAGRVFAGYLACQKTCPCLLLATSPLIAPSIFQLSRPHLSTSGGVWGCVRSYTKPPDFSKWFVWFVRVEESLSEALKGSRGMRWGAGSCLDGVCPHENMWELGRCCTGASFTKKKWPKINGDSMTGVPMHQKGPLILCTHMEKCSYCKQNFCMTAGMVHSLHVLEGLCWTGKLFRPGSTIPALMCWGKALHAFHPCWKS